MVYITSLFALVILSLLDSSQANSVIREHVLSEDEAEASTDGSDTLLEDCEEVEGEGAPLEGR